MRLRHCLGLLHNRLVRSLLGCPLNVSVLGVYDECSALELQFTCLRHGDDSGVALLDVLDLVLFYLFIWVDLDAIDASFFSPQAYDLVEHLESKNCFEFSEAELHLRAYFA